MFNVDKQHTEWGIDPDVQDSITIADENKGVDSIIERAISIIKAP